MRSLATVAAIAVPATSANAQVLEQIIAHPALIEPPNEEHFGHSVDISGDALIVGAPSYPFAFLDGHTGCGIYERVGGTWTLAYDRLQQFPNENNAGWDVAIDGEWAAFSVLALNVAGQGVVHVLHRDAGGWVETQILTSPVAGDVDAFGVGVDISGTLMVVGSSYQNRAFVFRRTGSTWAHEATLVMPAGYVDPDSGFGESVAVSQTEAREAVVVGQPGYDSVGGPVSEHDGAVHIFVADESGWGLNVSVPATAAPSLQGVFGHPVAIDGDFAAAGALYSFSYEPPFTANGGATVLQWDGSVFAPSTLIVGEPEEYAGLGLAIQGDRVFAGRTGWRGIDLDQASGRVTGHRWTGSGWTGWPASGGSFHRVESPVGQQGFGATLAASGGRLVVGVPGAINGGSIHVLNVAKEGWKWSDAAVGGLDTVVGSTGPARLIGEGSLGAGDGHRLHLHDARPSIIVTLIVGVTTLNAPFKGGVLVPNPLLFLYVPTNAAGDFHITTNFPGGVPAGVPLWHHFWWPDPAGPAGLASSNAIRGITP